MWYRNFFLCVSLKCFEKPFQFHRKVIFCNFFGVVGFTVLIYNPKFKMRYLRFKNYSRNSWVLREILTSLIFVIDPMGVLVKVNNQIRRANFCTNFAQFQKPPGVNQYLFWDIQPSCSNVTFKWCIFNFLLLMFSPSVLSELLCLNTEGLFPSIVNRIGWESRGRITTVSAVNTNYSIITTEIPIQHCFPLSPRLCLTIRSGSKCFPCYPEASHQPTMNLKPQNLWCLGIISHMSNPFSSSHKLSNAPPFDPSPNNPFIVPCQHFSAPLACGIPLIAQNWVCNLFLHPISVWGYKGSFDYKPQMGKTRGSDGCCKVELLLPHPVTLFVTNACKKKK